MKKPALNSDLLRSKLKLKHLTSQTTLFSHHPHVRKMLASGALATTLMLTPAQSTMSQAALPGASDSPLVSSLDLRQAMIDQLKDILPPTVEPLSEGQETRVSQLFHQIYGIHASAELEGNKLNRSYGLIGAEQHLPRYPGDTAEAHGQFVQSGITPGRGAWGYFAPSQSQLTPELIEKEKYYVAVQTLYLPDWNTRLAYLRDWYKHRKVLVVNPHNGRAIVAVVADSGPAAFTGKHFGGSPEVMAYLERKDGRQRGPVILFFVDDPQDQVPLGPLEQNLEKGPPLLSNI
jgi:hypothetical protein